MAVGSGSVPDNLFVMDAIPVHRMSDVLDGRNIFLLRVPGAGEYSDGTPFSHIEYAHRDDYYSFFLVTDGEGRVSIDFREYDFGPNSVHCIMPGQVHRPASEIGLAGWFLAVDALLVKSEYKEIFEKKSFSGVPIRASDNEVEELIACLSLIEGRSGGGIDPVERGVTSDLISAFIGMVADVCRRDVSASLNNRAAAITLQFRSLLSENYRTMKKN